MARVAAIDIGTNTVLLCIAEQRGRSSVALLELERITRLGEGVDETRVLSPVAVERTLAALAEYAELVRTHACSEIHAVGTSALRDARGGAEFLGSAERVLGTRPRVIRGDEEARLTFRGALSGLDLTGPALVFDVGGGSTELALGSAGARNDVSACASLDIGSVRLFERHVATDPPTPSELQRVRAAVREALAQLDFVCGNAALVGVAGTVVTLAKLHRMSEPCAERFDETELHGATLSEDAIESTLARLSAMPLAARLGLAGLDPRRADVIPVGAALVSEVVRWSGKRSLRVSTRGVRWGLVERALEQK